MKKVIINRSVKKIGYAAFDSCYKLTSILVPDSVTEIGEYAFAHSDNLVIYGYNGSYVQTYAKENNIPFSQLERLKNNSTVTSDAIILGESVTINCVAKGGSGDYSYQILAKHSTDSSNTTLQSYNSTSQKIWKPSKTGTYTILVNVLDTQGYSAIKNLTVNVYDVLKNKSTISETDIISGQSITLKGSASGGIGDYQYAMLAKHSTASSYTTLQSYNSTATRVWKPSKTGTYNVVIKVKDSKGNVAEKNFQVNIRETLKNNSTVSATNITIGQSITLKGVASGGFGDYQYAMFAKHSTASSYTTLKSYSSTNTRTWTPYKTGTYSVIIKVKDSKDNVVKKSFTITINDELKNNSKVSATNITLGQSVVLNGVATGGTAPYKYKYYCKPEGDKDWTALTGSTTAISFTHKPARTIKYQYAVKIADSKGKTATKYFIVNVSPAPLANASLISATSIKLGDSIKLTGKATGGTAPYKYKYYCKPEDDKDWTALTGSTTATSFTHKPARTIKYQYAVKIADSKGKTATKYFTVNVSPAPLANASSISATSIKLGASIKLTGKATGGTAPYKYKYYCKPEGDKDWTALTGSTTATSFTHKPARTIKYQYAVKIADSKGKTATKYFTISVSE